MEGSLPHSQVSATCPYPEPDQSNLKEPLQYILSNDITPATSQHHYMTSNHSQITFVTANTGVGNTLYKFNQVNHKERHPRCVVEITTCGMSNTAIFIGSILSIYYMFRQLMLAIFRLYMNTYQVINFRFQLNEQYFISIVMFLYMFRAHLCPSSGGPLYIYIWFYVSLFWWSYSWKVGEGLTNLPTVRSPKETHIEPDVVNIQRSSWGWAQVSPKHVEEHNYRNKILRIKLESEVN